jgi:hypothetical protein
MDTSNTQVTPSTASPRPATAKFGLGGFLVFLAALLALAAVILIWFGIFPGLVAIGLAIPLGLIGARLMRAGKPATTLRD